MKQIKKFMHRIAECEREAWRDANSEPSQFVCFLRPNNALLLSYCPVGGGGGRGSRKIRFVIAGFFPSLLGVNQGSENQKGKKRRKVRAVESEGFNRSIELDVIMIKSDAYSILSYCSVFLKDVMPQGFVRKKQKVRIIDRTDKEESKSSVSMYGEMMIISFLQYPQMTPAPSQNMNKYDFNFYTSVLSVYLYFYGD